MTGKPKRFVMLLFQRQETRPPDSARRTRTDHVSKHYNDIRMCVYSASADLYAHSQTCSNQFTLRSLASFLLRTVDGSRNLLITPINGTNHNGRARFFRKMKIKEPRLLAIKSSLSSGYF